VEGGRFLVRPPSPPLADASASAFFWFVAEHRECWSSSPGEPVHTATRELTGQFYRGIRGGMQLFGRGLDVSTGSPALQQRPPDRRERTPVCGAAWPNGGLGTITPDGHRQAHFGGWR